MKNQVDVSIIMSVFNEKHEWIEESINSILAQSFKEYEFIIVNDNPKNEKLKLLLDAFQKKDNRIRVLTNKKNLGLALSLNVALEASRGKYIARFDADDISLKERIKTQVEFLNSNTEIGLVGTNISFIDENSNDLNKSQTVITSYEEIKKYIKYKNTFHHPTWMFRKEILEKIKGYRNFPSAQDYDFICRCILNNILCTNINEILVKYRIRENSISVSKKYQQSSIVHYIQKLYSASLKNKVDNFNDQKFERELIRLKSTQEKYESSEKNYELGKNKIKSKNYFVGIYLVTKSIFILPVYRIKRIKNALFININNLN